MIECLRYSANLQQSWDQFVRGSRSPHFFFERGYVEYHADRFIDHSLIFVHDGHWIAVLPACESAMRLHSHQGLTHGGLLCTERMGQAQMLDVFRALRDYLGNNGLSGITYKALPAIYYFAPAQDDLYALSRLGAQLVRREASSVLPVAAQRKGYTKGKKHSLSLARRAGVKVERSDRWEDFMALLISVLEQRHETRPVHTTAEIRMLADRFPDHIQLYLATVGNHALAGAVVFVNRTVVHTQYMASSDEGRGCGALDATIDHLICNAFADKTYLSFGISTEQGGAVLNNGLIQSKEAYGARTLVQDVYEMNL